MSIQQMLQAAKLHHQAGRLQQAESICRQVLARDPDCPDVMHLLGVILYQTGRANEAMPFLRRSVQLDPARADYLCNLGLVLAECGRADEATAAFEQAIQRQPNFPTAYNNLGVVLQSRGRTAEAIAALQQAVKLSPEYPDAHNNLGTSLIAAGRLDEAITAFRRALALHPQFAQAHHELAMALRAKDRLDESLLASRKAVELKPDFPEAYAAMGNTLQDLGRLDEAAAAFRRALALRPDFAAAAFNLGNALRAAAQIDQAVAAYHQAIDLRADFVDAWINLANAYKDAARLDEMLAAYDHILKDHPDHAAAHGCRLYGLYFRPDYDAKAILQEHLEWDRRHAQPLAAAIQPHANDRNPDRRLKIGYVSPDLCNHCQSFFTTPLLSHHHHEQFEVFCYASVERPDQLTQRLRGYADVWRDCLGQSDADVARMIRQDQIDILVDLTMHMANGRPLVFARKPAPVQVAWLAYPGTTGMTAMDYRLTDPYLDPPDADGDYVEKSIRLPDTFWCYDPLTDQPPVGALPALSVGHVTFGCLNNFCKVNAGTLELWSQVLSAVPGSRLILLCPQGSHRPQVLEKLKVQADRVEFVEFAPREQYLKRYHRIDIGLDTFPYNGHTTSLDSLWMGVPVVSMVGQRAVSRAGWSQSKNLGLAEQLVGQRPQDFVSLAVGLAGDLPRLSQMRGQLRLRMEKSPLMDADRFARKVEEAYRQMWHTFMNSTA